MRRMSMREMGFRFAPGDQTRVRIERIERGQAVAVLAGVECRLDLARSERRDIGNAGSVRARISSYPRALGDGSLAKGTKPSKAPWGDAFLAGSRDRQVRLNFHALTLEWSREPYEAFVRRHPVGTLVEAEVAAVFGHNIRLQFEGGLQSRMSIGDYWDQWPFCRRTDRAGFRVPNRIEVTVRRIDPGRRFLNVSMHGYPQDGKYCNTAAGYRSTYDARQGMFRLLPWERSRKVVPIQAITEGCTEWPTSRARGI